MKGKKGKRDNNGRTQDTLEQAMDNLNDLWGQYVLTNQQADYGSPAGLIVSVIVGLGDIQNSLDNYRQEQHLHRFARCSSHADNPWQMAQELNEKIDQALSELRQMAKDVEYEGPESQLLIWSPIEEFHRRHDQLITELDKLSVPSLIATVNSLVDLADDIRRHFENDSTPNQEVGGYWELYSIVRQQGDECLSQIRALQQTA